MTMNKVAVFQNMGAGLSAPPVSGFAITPRDGSDLAVPTRGIYVGVAGDIKVTFLNDDDGTSVTLKSVPVGFHSLMVKRVWSTGTAATNMIGLA